MNISPEKQRVSSGGLRKAHTSLCDTFLDQGAEKRPINPYLESFSLQCRARLGNKSTSKDTRDK